VISLEDVLLLHRLSLNDYGGAEGIRDLSLLLSAINRPFQTFDGKELYTTPFEKCAAIAESLIINHPFVDGNKRTGLLCMIALLNEYNIVLTSNPAELYDFVIAIAMGEIRYKEITEWLVSNTK